MLVVQNRRYIVFNRGLCVSRGGFALVRGGLTFKNFKIGGDWSFVWGDNPTEGPRGDGTVVVYRVYCPLYQCRAHTSTHLVGCRPNLEVLNDLIPESLVSQYSLLQALRPCFSCQEDQSGPQLGGNTGIFYPQIFKDMFSC